MYLNDYKRLRKYAHRMETKPTMEEKFLLENMKKERANLGYYICQKVIVPYIADFFFSDKQLIVEIDGDFHDSNTKQQSYDTKRDIFLMSFGLTVWRFTNKEVLVNSRSIIKKIESFTPTNRTKHLNKKIRKHNTKFNYGEFPIHLFKRTFRYELIQRLYPIITWRYFGGYLPISGGVDKIQLSGVQCSRALLQRIPRQLYFKASSPMERGD